MLRRTALFILLLAGCTGDLGGGGGGDEGNELKRTATASGGRVRLYRLWNALQTDHFYTTSITERDAAVQNHGYALEDEVIYVHTTPGEGREPLHRYYSGAAGDHFYTTLGNGDAIAGYSYEGIQCYVYGQPGDDRVRLYRHFSVAASDHFYTTLTSQVPGYTHESWEQIWVYDGLDGGSPSEPLTSSVKVASGLADPDIIQFGDYYVITGSIGTTEWLPFYRTKDLRSYELFSKYNPSSYFPASRFCAVWAGGLARREGRYVIYFSAIDAGAATSCPDLSYDEHINRETMYKTATDDFLTFDPPTIVGFSSSGGPGPAANLYGIGWNVLKIDPSVAGDRLFYTWYGNGNNVASIDLTNPGLPAIAHTTAKDWGEWINEGAQGFQRGAFSYVQFSEGIADYKVRVIKADSLEHCVRSAENTRLLTSPARSRTCQSQACIFENRGHGSVFNLGDQYYFIHHRGDPRVDLWNRDTWLSPVYFRSTGDLVSMTDLHVSWSSRPGFVYSLDVKLTSGESIGPCLNSGVVGTSTSVTFNQFCDSVDRFVPRESVAAVRVCGSGDNWSSARCTDEAAVKLAEDTYPLVFKD